MGIDSNLQKAEEYKRTKIYMKIYHKIMNLPLNSPLKQIARSHMYSIWEDFLNEGRIVPEELRDKDFSDQLSKLEKIFDIGQRERSKE